MSVTNQSNEIFVNLFVTGINFKKANVNIRSGFSLNAEQSQKCYDLAKENGFTDFIVLSTCNRTEIYGIGSAQVAEQILLGVCNQLPESYNQYKFTKTSKNALEHIFYVASGLDSQILGDYEILGQFRNACKISKSNNLLGHIFERMSNICIQSSKEIKTKTAFSKGTVSASYAVIEVIKERFGNKCADVLLIGTGKLGHNIAKNIHHYLPHIQLSITNRTQAKAHELSLSFGFNELPFDQFIDSMKNYDIVIVCADVSQYTLSSAFFLNGTTTLILDLAIPQSVHPDVRGHNGIEVLDIDSISSIMEQSIEKRKQYIPDAIEIINHYILIFYDWYKLYSQREHILVLKELLSEESKKCPFLSIMDNNIREKRVNDALQEFVKKLKQTPDSEIDLDMAIERFKKLNHQLEKSH